METLTPKFCLVRGYRLESVRVGSGSLTLAIVRWALDWWLMLLCVCSGKPGPHACWASILPWDSTPNLAINSCCNCVDMILMLSIGHQEYQAFLVPVNLMLINRKSPCQWLSWAFSFIFLFRQSWLQCHLGKTETVKNLLPGCELTCSVSVSRLPVYVWLNWSVSSVSVVLLVSGIIT